MVGFTSFFKAAYGAKYETEGDAGEGPTSRAMDIWALIENPAGNTTLSDNVIYDEDPVEYAKQGNLFCMESHRETNFTRAIRVSRAEWKQLEFFGEVALVYTPGCEFPDALVRNRQSQYGATERRRLDRGGDADTR